MQPHHRWLLALALSVPLVSARTGCDCDGPCMKVTHAQRRARVDCRRFLANECEQCCADGKCTQRRRKLTSCSSSGSSCANGGVCTCSQSGRRLFGAPSSSCSCSPAPSPSSPPPPPSPSPPPPQLYAVGSNGLTCAMASTWLGSSNFCTSQGQQLCSHAEVCPGATTFTGHPNTNAASLLATWMGGIQSTDNWIAIQPVTVGNYEWMEIGTRNPSDLCMVVSGFGGNYVNFNTWPSGAACEATSNFVACCG